MQGSFPFLFVCIHIVEGFRTNHQKRTELSYLEKTGNTMQEPSGTDVENELNEKLNSLLGNRSNLREKIDTLKDISEWLEGAVANQNSSGDSTSTHKRVCCCRKGRCLKDEKGVRGERAMELHGAAFNQCCKYKTICRDYWFSGGDRDCDNVVGDEIEKTISKVEASPNYTLQECHDALRAMVNKTKIEANRFCFHGKCVLDFHSTQLGEEIIHDLLVKGRPLHDGSLGAKFFEIKEYVKLLWSGADRALRAFIKQNTGSGELSRGRETAFARVMEDPKVKQAFSCSMPAFWEAASGSFANVGSYKPLLVVLQKPSEAALEDTAFWKTELRGIAQNPPRGAIVVVISKGGSNGLSCSSVMRNLRYYIQRLTRSTRSAKDKWNDRSNLAFACGEVDIRAEGALPSDELLRNGLPRFLVPHKLTRPALAPVKQVSVSEGVADGVNSSTSTVAKKGRSSESANIQTHTNDTEPSDEASSVVLAERLNDRVLTGRAERTAATTEAQNHYTQFPPPYVSASRLRHEFGASLEELFQSGYSPGELQEAGFDNAAMHAAGFQSFDFENPPALGKHPNWESFWTWAKLNNKYLNGPPSLGSGGPLGHEIPNSNRRLDQQLKNCGTTEASFDHDPTSFHIFVKDLSGQLIATIAGKPSDKIELIRQKICVHQKHPWNREYYQMGDLLFLMAKNGKRLEDYGGRTLGDYGIKKDDTIVVTKRPNHRMIRSSMNVDIFVKTLTGKTLKVQSLPDDTILIVKHKISEAWGIPIGNQRLIFAGVETGNEKTLRDYNAIPEATIHLVERLPPPP